MSKSSEELRMECLQLATVGREGFGADQILAVASQFAAFVLGSSTTKAEPKKTEKLKAPTPEPIAPKPKPEPKKVAKPFLEDQPVVSDDPEDDGRSDKIATLTADLTADQRMVMKAILGRVPTKHLDAAFRQYLPQVLQD